jgi:hypothetical protein
MRARILVCCFLTFAGTIGRAEPNSDPKSLYASHNWKALYVRLKNTNGPPLYRGAIGVTFNQDLEASERLLLSVINSAPGSSEAYEAYEWLSWSAKSEINTHLSI